MKGTLIFFNYKKRFGFMKGEDGNSYFFGIGNFNIKTSGIRKALKKNAALQFKVEANEKGPIATEIEFAE